jgi:hypothetical protein
MQTSLKQYDISVSVQEQKHEFTFDINIPSVGMSYRP